MPSVFSYAVHYIFTYYDFFPDKIQTMGACKEVGVAHDLSCPVLQVIKILLLALLSVIYYEGI